MLKDEEGEETFTTVDQEGMISPRLVLQGMLNVTQTSSP